MAPESRSAAIRRLGELSRLTRELHSSAGDYVEDGRLRDLQFEASELGRELGELVILGLDRVEEFPLNDTAAAARDLHLAEGLSFTLGGGQIDALVHGLDNAADQTEKAFRALDFDPLSLGGESDQDQPRSL